MTPTAKNIAKGILMAVGILAAVALGLYLVYELQTVILYIFVALILALIGKPIARFFRTRLKFPNTLATIVTLFIFLCFVGLFIYMFVPLISSQGKSLSALSPAEMQQRGELLWTQFSGFLESYGIDSEKLAAKSGVASKINFDFIPDFLNKVLGAVSGFSVGLASVMFITFFFIKDRVMFMNAAKKFIPQSHEEPVLNSVEKINDLLSRYFLGLVLQLGIIFVMYLIVLLIFGIDNPLIIAFICGILNIIPYVGPVIASLLAAVLTMISHIGNDFRTETLPVTIYILIAFSVVQFIDNNFSQPIIFSKSTNSHPLEIFLVILAAGFLFGIFGMVMAVPLYTALKVIAKEFFPENKFVQLLTRRL